MGVHPSGGIVVTQGQALQASQLDPSNWGGWGESVGQLVTALGGAVVVREIVKQVFARANKGDDTAALARADLRIQVADLVTRVDALQSRLDAASEKTNALFAENAELRAENRGLRSRYHRLLNWLQTVESLPDLPAYLAEPVEGPTARDAAPRPPEHKP